MINLLIKLFFTTALLVTILTGCSSDNTYFSITDRYYIIPQGEKFISLEDGKYVETTAPVDLIAEGKGNFLEKEQKLNDGE